MYTCFGKDCPQCEPCEEPYKVCTQYCTFALASFGDLPTSCKNQDGTSKACGECSECIPIGGSGLYEDPNQCVPKPNDGFTPCTCFDSESACGDCQACDTESGDCEPQTGLCETNCNCFVTCPCGVTLQGTHSQEVYANGPGCASNCRAKTYADCAEYCPPAKDPCKADPNNKCEVACECKTYRTDCGQSPPPCPDGKTCTSQGQMFSGATESGNCSPISGQLGGVYHFRKECTRSNDPECQECDCNCENDCGDCEICSASGTCVPDPECDEACDVGEVRCGSDCCQEGQECMPQDCVSFTDACHGIFVEVCGPAGSSFGLAHTADIPAESAVCGRFHTHCTITVNGSPTGKQHLDCQAGLPAPQKGSGFACV